MKLRIEPGGKRRERSADVLRPEKTDQRRFVAERDIPPEDWEEIKRLFDNHFSPVDIVGTAVDASYIHPGFLQVPEEWARIIAEKLKTFKVDEPFEYFTLANGLIQLFPDLDLRSTLDKAAKTYLLQYIQDCEEQGNWFQVVIKSVELVRLFPEEKVNLKLDEYWTHAYSEFQLMQKEKSSLSTQRFFHLVLSLKLLFPEHVDKLSISVDKWKEITNQINFFKHTEESFTSYFELAALAHLANNDVYLNPQGQIMVQRRSDDLEANHPTLPPRLVA